MNPNAPNSALNDTHSNALWDRVDSVLELNQPAVPEGTPIARRRRRSFSPGEMDARATLELQRDADGLLRWDYQPPARRRAGGRRTYRSTGVDRPEVVKRFRFMDLEGNDITTGLQALDARLTPGRGLLRLADGAWVPAAGTVDGALAGRVLLLVHGTFSSSRMYLDELRATPHGTALLAAWQARYDHVLAFDHPTLAVGAWSNALDLQWALAGVGGDIDMVCHSRGGLVAAWLLRLEALRPGRIRRVVFVGSPLTGTSLASPPRLRAALDLLANYAEAAAGVAMLGAAALPIAAGAAGLARIFGKTLRLGSSLPLADAAVSLVPGLASQQRIANNLELRQLFSTVWKPAPEAWAVSADFRPSEIAQGWKFWNRFTHIGDQLKYAGADLVFSGQNDLVVDTEAMNQLGELGLIDPGRTLTLGTGPDTHHTNYFQSVRVCDFLGRVLSPSPS